MKNPLPHSYPKGKRWPRGSWPRTRTVRGRPTAVVSQKQDLRQPLAAGAPHQPVRPDARPVPGPSLGTREALKSGRPPASQPVPPFLCPSLPSERQGDFNGQERPLRAPPKTAISCERNQQA